MKYGIGWALLALAMSTVSLPAAAQRPGPAVKFSGFLCQIDLEADDGSYNFNTTQYVAQPIRGGIVYTFDSEKLCTNSQSNENIKIDCAARIPDWIGPSVSLKDVSCKVSGAACGIQTNPPLPLTAINNRLTIDSAGNARLTCQVK